MSKRNQFLKSCLWADSDAVRNGVGQNVILPPEKESLWKLYFEKFKDPIIIVLLVVFCHDGGVVDRLAVLAFQHAALQPYLIGPGEHGHVVEQHVVLAVVGENQCSRGGDEECLEASFKTLGLENQHP